MKKRSLKKVALTLAAALAASAVLTACSSKTGGSDTQPASAEAGVPREQRVRPEKRAAQKDTLNVGSAPNRPHWILICNRDRPRV